MRRRFIASARTGTRPHSSTRPRYFFTLVSRRERAAMWLIGIGDPCAGLGEFGHPVWCRLPLNTFEKPFIECSQ